MDDIKTLKDGNADFSDRMTQNYFKSCSQFDSKWLNLRKQYYRTKLCDPLYRDTVAAVAASSIKFPQRIVDQDELYSALMEVISDLQSTSYSEGEVSNLHVLEDHISMIPEDRIDFDDSNLIGHGSFSNVYSATLKMPTGELNQVVLKLHKNKNPPSANNDLSSECNFYRQIKIALELLIHMRFSSHPNVVTMLGYQQGSLGLILERMDRGDLRNLLYYSDNPQVEATLCDGRVKKKIILGILNGLAALHKSDILHGDIKPSNIMIAHDYTPKLIDFGISVAIMSPEHQHSISKMLGSAGYMAPELLLDSDPSLSHSTSQPIAIPALTKATDMFSAGIVINEVIQEEEPYYEHLYAFYADGEVAVEYVTSGGRPVMTHTSLAEDLRTLIGQCWATDPCARPDAEDTFIRLVNIDVPSSYPEHD
jgi:serine/threonine protein kinase